MASTIPDREATNPDYAVWKAKRSDAVGVAQYCPDRPYLECEIPSHVKRVHRIVFTTLSHDQGFSDSGGDAIGTYSGSFSWFEAALITPSGHDRVDRRRIQFNLHGISQKKKHVNTWDDSSGNADIQQFLQSIHAGDIVAIVPKARHVGWRNYVYEAEIEVHAEQEDPMGQLSRGLSQQMRNLELDASRFDNNAIYRPLQEASAEIRLIKVESGKFDDEIMCELCYATLGDPNCLPYEALSYCWGDSGDVRSITVRNTGDIEGAEKETTMLITANLHSAFRYLRRDDGQPLTLWADAVCINQLNLEERARQVSLMPQIYAQASSIMIWLGEATEGAVASIQDTIKFTKRYKALERHPKGEDQVGDLHAPLLREGSLLVDSPLFEYDYFHRTWVLQEAFNARNVTVHCGAHVIGWAEILRMNQCLTKSMLIPNPVGKHVLPALFAGLFEVIDEGSHPLNLTYKPLPGRLEILDVIMRGLDLEASDVRDKIFALLTFGQETHLFENLPKSILPDYTKTTPQVYADFTRWWIISHKSLRILSSVQVTFGRTWQAMTQLLPEIQNLEQASWSLWHTGKSFWSRGTLGLAKECSYSAAAGTLPGLERLTDSSDPLILSLSGHEVARIGGIGPYPFAYMLRHVGECKNASTCALHELHAAYQHVFDPIDERGTWRYGAQLDTSALRLQRRPNTAQEAPRKLFDHGASHYWSQGTLECHGSCYFNTTKGLMGLCPPAAREQDLVVVLHGGNVPYILRPREMGPDEKPSASKEKSYYFIGECYLQNYMHGLAIGENMTDKGGLAQQVFHLV